VGGVAASPTLLVPQAPNTDSGLAKFQHLRFLFHSRFEFDKNYKKINKEKIKGSVG
jgi:hypothetical protein